MSLEQQQADMERFLEVGGKSSAAFASLRSDVEDPCLSKQLRAAGAPQDADKRVVSVSEGWWK